MPQELNSRLVVQPVLVMGQRVWQRPRPHMVIRPTPAQAPAQALVLALAELLTPALQQVPVMVRMW